MGDKVRQKKTELKGCGKAKGRERIDRGSRRRTEEDSVKRKDGNATDRCKETNRTNLQLTTERARRREMLKEPLSQPSRR